tara:strand:+ start:13531 stop:14046 length:516 start_codon:yes stop_codon:yes gene_type:complete
MKNKISPYKTDDNTIDNLKITSTNLIKNTKNVTQDIVDDIEKFYVGWKDFAFKENIIDIAVGMIVARSFKNTVNSIVVDIIMPLLIGFGMKANVHDLFIVLVNGKNKPINGTYITLEDAKKDGAVTLNYGTFINVFFDLIFVTLCLYVSIKLLYRCKRKVKKTKNTIKDLL